MIIFDCDGTLVDSEVIAARVFPEVWAKHGIVISEEDFMSRIVGTGPDNALKKEIASRLPPDAAKEALALFHRELHALVRPVRGIPTLLAELSHETLSVASNSSRPYVVDVLKWADLHTHFGDRLFSGRDVARPKPAPDVFLHAAATLGFSASECIVVEDSVTGIEAAKAAGMRVVAFAAGLHCSEDVIARIRGAGADRFCATTDELRAVLLERHE